MSTETKPPMIYGKIADCIAEVEAVGKNHKNQQQGYSFRAIDDFYDALQPVFSKHRIFIAPTILEHTREERTTKSGGTMMTTITKVRYKIFAEDGSFIEADALGEGADSGDKSANKSAAQAVKYLFMQVFAVRVNGENLDTERDSPQYTPKPKKVTPPPAKTTPPAPSTPKPTTAASVLPKAATEATRKWAWDQLCAKFGAEDSWNFLLSKGWITETQTDHDWPLDKVPTNRGDLDAMYREIELVVQVNTPPEQADGLPEDLRNIVITVPRAGMKRAEYLKNPDLLGTLYDASSTDEAARRRLWGIVKGWTPSEWVGNDGKKNPPNKDDVALRQALDRFLEWHDKKG